MPSAQILFWTTMISVDPFFSASRHCFIICIQKWRLAALVLKWSCWQILIPDAEMVIFGAKLKWWMPRALEMAYALNLLLNFVMAILSAIGVRNVWPAKVQIRPLLTCLDTVQCRPPLNCTVALGKNWGNLWYRWMQSINRAIGLGSVTSMAWNTPCGQVD